MLLSILLDITLTYCIDAVGPPVTRTVIQQTIVDISTRYSSISLESWRTLTRVRSIEVDARG